MNDAILGLVDEYDEMDELDYVDIDDDDEGLVIDKICLENAVMIMGIDVMVDEIDDDAQRAIVDDDEGDDLHRETDENDEIDLQRYVIKQIEVVDLLLLLDETVAILVTDTVYIDLHLVEHLLL